MLKSRAGKEDVLICYRCVFFFNFNIENKNHEPLNVFEETALMYCDNCDEGNKRSIKICSY